MTRTPFAAIAAACLLAAPAPADAHITLQPKVAVAGAFTEESVRVPNERDTASTYKVVLALPAGFTFVSYEPKPGWKVRVNKQKLATPIQTPDGPITEQTTQIVWTTSRKGHAKIAPGQYMNFRLSLLIPGKPGDVLTFQAIQYYDNGEVVRWVGPPTAKEPAPRITLVAAAA